MILTTTQANPYEEQKDKTKSTRIPASSFIYEYKHETIKSCVLETPNGDDPAILAYKKVAQKVRPVPGVLPEEFRIVRRKHPDPLRTMLPVPTQPRPFVPTRKLTKERIDALGIDKNEFLWPEEQALVVNLVMNQEDALAWTEDERGAFTSEYFDPVRIPMYAHIPWVHRNIPIPPGILDKTLELLREKIRIGVIEPSNSSYRCRTFCLTKKDGESLRFITDLQSLNAYAIPDSAVPPNIEVLAESCGGRACYTELDFYVAFDQRQLHEDSRDLTTFQTPLGTFRMTVLPMGYTNSLQILHNDLAFVLQDEIPHICNPYADDCPVLGPKTRYQQPDGTYETLPDNPNVRRFVYEHLCDVNRVLQRIKAVGGTVSGKKLRPCMATALFVGHKLTIQGREPDESKLQKIADWPTCDSVTEVRGFLGTVGVLRVFIRDFARMARPLHQLTRKNNIFEWGEEEQDAMDALKHAVTVCPALCAIDYSSEFEVILAVDSSIIGVGWFLAQGHADGRRRYNRFGSLNWTTVQANYSQPKIELFGLFRALRAVRLYIVGVKNLVVEMDAAYIKGMLNNPDIQPNATINRWIAGILLFTFKLRHIPAAEFTCTDGLSRRRAAPEDPPEEDDFESWIDETYGFYISTCLIAQTRRRRSSRLEGVPPADQAQEPEKEDEADEDAQPPADQPSFPASESAIARDQRLITVRNFLEDPTRPEDMDDRTFHSFIRYASQFFVQDNKLWKKHRFGKHQLVIDPPRRWHLVRTTHDDMGHKGVYAVRARLLDRFWWPSLGHDVKYYVRTCHECQIRQTTQLLVPPTVPPVASLFQKIHIDTKHMPKAGGFQYIVHARCSLSKYPEFRLLREESGYSIGQFIFEDLLCRYGACPEFVTDNGGPFVAALDYLRSRYHINHIKISAYNSQANGLVERRHYDVQEALIKAAEGNDRHWYKHAPAVFWAERITINKTTGLSPFYLAHGVEPLLPFDIAEATYLMPPQDEPLTTEELLALRAKALEKRHEDLDRVAKIVSDARHTYAKHFAEINKARIRDYDFEPGRLVLLRNSRVKMELNRKTKPRYLGPYVVIRRTEGGSYIIAELNGATAKHRVAAFRLIPYFPRHSLTVPVTKLIEDEDDSDSDP